MTEASTESAAAIAVAWPGSAPAVAPTPLQTDAGGVADARGSAGAVPSPLGGSSYLRTEEAARYLRKSSSWLLKRHDIPYLKGVPNIYRKKDLDDWFERNMFEPSIN